MISKYMETKSKLSQLYGIRKIGIDIYINFSWF